MGEKKSCSAQTVVVNDLDELSSLFQIYATTAKKPQRTQGGIPCVPSGMWRGWSGYSSSGARASMYNFPGSHSLLVFL